MKHIKKIVYLLVFGFFVMGICGYLGYKYKILGTDDGIYENSIEVKAPITQRINKDTVLEFQYNYTDGITTTQCLLPQSYMDKYDRETLANCYSSWQMESFSPNKVVFVKNFDSESTQHYIIKEYKGYVGVFYKKTGMLKELTSTPVSSLSDDEKEKIKNEIVIDGDDNLMKFLESFET
ncbi:MAG: hypothetical protein ACI4VF_00885 [Lachnospirales bacterium]